MPQNPTLYTGRRDIPNPGFQSSAAAMAGAGRGIVQATQQDVAMARQDANDLQDLMRVNPISVANQKVMELQAEELEGLTQRGTALMAQRDGRLTEQDKIQLRADQDTAVAKQNMWKADYDRIMGEYARLNPARDDMEYANKVLEEYNKTGVYPGGIRKPRPISTAEHVGGWNDYIKDAVSSTQTVEELGPGKHRYRTVNAWRGESDEEKEENALSAYKSFVLGDYTGMQSQLLMNEFAKLDADVQEEYLTAADQNFDGDYNKVERTNAIVNYGWTEYGRPIAMEEMTTERAYRKTAAQRDDERNSYEFKVSRVKRDRYGWGEGDKVKFSEQDDISATFGSVDKGIKFSYAKADNNDGYINVPIDVFDEEFKTKFPGQTSLDVRPQVIGNGKVEWTLKEGEKRVPITSTEYAMNIGKSGYVKEGDQYYRIEETDTQSITSPYDKAKAHIAAEYPHLDVIVPKQKTNLGID